MPSKQKKQQHAEELKRHRGFLDKVKQFSIYRPKYDLMSLHNNLLLHRQYDPKQQLKPAHQSSKIAGIEKQIKLKKKEGSPKQGEKVEKWYEKVLAAQEPTQKRFNFTYEPSGLVGWGASSRLKRTYRITSNINERHAAKSSSLYGSFRR